MRTLFLFGLMTLISAQIVDSLQGRPLRIALMSALGVAALLHLVAVFYDSGLVRHLTTGAVSLVWVAAMCHTGERGFMKVVQACALTLVGIGYLYIVHIDKTASPIKMVPYLPSL